MINAQTPDEHFTFFRGAVEQLDKRFGSLEGAVATLRDEMKQGFDRVDDRLSAVDKRFDVIDRKFDTVDKKFDSLTTAMQSWIRWCVGTTAIVGATLLGAVILRLH